jgi:hypothetical protein
VRSISWRKGKCRSTDRGGSRRMSIYEELTAFSVEHESCGRDVVWSLPEAHLDDPFMIRVRAHCPKCRREEQFEGRLDDWGPPAHWPGRAGGRARGVRERTQTAGRHARDGHGASDRVCPAGTSTSSAALRVRAQEALRESPDRGGLRTHVIGSRAVPPSTRSPLRYGSNTRTSTLSQESGLSAMNEGDERRVASPSRRHR